MHARTKNFFFKVRIHIPYKINGTSSNIIIITIIIIMYIYHAPINALSAHMIHVNLNMIFYTHAEHSPTKTLYI